MIVGIFQRHYKIYKGASFHLFHANDLGSMTTFIGNNGFGKSSILEACDTFFNNRDFNVCLNEKRSEAFVAPIFAIDQEQFEKLSVTTQKIVSVISSFLWEERINASANYNQYTNFFEFRDEIKDKQEGSYYLVCCSKELESNDRYFFTFTSSIIKAIELELEASFTSKMNNALNSEIKNLYSYIYLPVESSIEDFLRLETSGMQSLIDKNITSEIDKILNKKSITRTVNSKKKHISLLNIINESLEKYIDDIEKRIKKIDNSYDFRTDQNKKKKLTSKDLKNHIIEAYITQRSLRKDKKSISNLSAGERKKALIDIAYSLISNSQERSQYIILGIDEPESSLHVSNCYEQFKRIEEISLSKQCQVLTTTHWYGALPILKKGTLVHIVKENNKTPTHARFSFKNYFEDRGNHPNDIQLKSFYDLSSSIISSLRNYDQSWLIVEGTDDLNYIQKLLPIDGINILPVGGCSIVRMLYDFLFVPLNHKAEKGPYKGKVLCLVDTDHTGGQIQHASETKNKIIMFRRLQNIQGEISLIRDERTERIPVEVEEILSPKDFFKAVSNVAIDVDATDVIELLKKYEITKLAKYSQIKGDESMLEFNGSAKDAKLSKIRLNNFIEEHKDQISNKYQVKDTTKLSWIEEIITFFKE